MAWPVRIMALDPRLDVSQYGHTAGKIRDGFAKESVTAFAQTRDSYLWSGAYAGLTRSYVSSLWKLRSGARSSG